MEKDDLKQALREVLREEHFTESWTRLEVMLGDRWKGGSIFMMPGTKETQDKEVPIDVFFHKIVMLRDNLRVLEQKINAHEKLSDEDKVGMQQYITRCYGTLTTFNVLFKDREDQFKGAGGH